jgi:hypothetical protein
MHRVERQHKRALWFVAGAVIISSMLMLIWPQTGWAQGVTEQLRSFFSTPAVPPPRLVLVFVDISGSIPQEDWDIYHRTYVSLVGPPEGREDKAALKKGQQGQHGDKLIVSTISEGTLVKFSPVAEGELRDTGRLRFDRENNESTLRALYGAFGTIKAMKHARRTLILDALTLSGQLIERDKDRRYVIVFLSDMLEDSGVADFEKKPPIQADTAAIIKKQRTSNLLPDLRQAQVYVAGAKAPNSSHLEAVKAFWMRYLHEANAVTEPGMYGRSAIDFEEAWRK